MLPVELGIHFPGLVGLRVCRVWTCLRPAVGAPSWQLGRSGSALPLDGSSHICRGPGTSILMPCCQCPSEAQKATLNLDLVMISYPHSLSIPDILGTTQLLQCDMWARKGVWADELAVILSTQGLRHEVVDVGEGSAQL
jgi:hypothetical protein